MAVYDQTYRPWTGTYGSRAGRVWAMIRMEIVQPFRNIWVLIVILAAFALVIAWLLLLFIALSRMGSTGAAPLPILTGNWLYRDGFYNFPASVGAGSLSLFSLILMFLSATVGSSLIARDLKYNALLLYFSRAITRADYLAGKFLALVLFLLFVTFVPGLLLFAGSLGMGTETLSAGDRARDLLGIFLQSLVFVVPMASAVLAFSSITKRPYVAAILWATVFFSSWIFSNLLTNHIQKDWCRMISWMNLTMHLGSLCYPERPAPKALLETVKPVLECGYLPPFLILSAVTILSLVVAWRRIRSVEGSE
jgi:ABC-type transport system involved in multi-copper enzyme maturation permease subunit